MCRRREARTFRWSSHAVGVYRMRNNSTISSHTRCKWRSKKKPLCLFPLGPRRIGRRFRSASRTEAKDEGKKEKAKDEVKEEG